MENRDNILKLLREEGNALEIPEALEPEQMKKRLKQQSAQKSAEKHKVRKFYKTFAAAAACLCVVILGISAFWLWSGEQHKPHQKEQFAENEEFEEAVLLETAESGISYPVISYEDIYAAMSSTWEENQYFYRGELSESGSLIDGVVAEGAVEESAAMEEAPAADYSEAEKQMAANDAFGETNVQTIGVDEGDIVKNDGRYLYQKIQVEENGRTKWMIQIVDTKDGLKEVARLDGIDGLLEFYIWEDVLVVIEEKYLDVASQKTTSAMKALYDVAYFANYYHEITFFDISDRSNPTGIKRFTLQGQYASSRIADGYFYGFSRYYANPGEGEKDYDAYIPVMDGARLEADRIYLPEKTNVTSYLVLVAIDLRNPTKFTDTTGIVSGGDLYYVSSDHIFVADAQEMERKEGWSSNQTNLLQFSYGDGRFALQATGKVKGQLEGSFSMDEYEKHLRLVTTVREYQYQEITDDRTGEVIGMNIVNDRQSNALYVLDDTLTVVGKVEGLAKDEQIYSARFMGNTGYFVTFRQTDPLFTVDLSNPAEPKVLSELKVSGFSEYLHIYGEDRLLGIGMEADEETGRQEGMKLSMFNVSDKSNVTEVTKKNLTSYEYSEALYNHRAVMISVEKNVFGFEAEGYKGGYYKDYLVYTYENDQFVQKLKADAKNAEGTYYNSVRGTFIGDTFYLLLGDGTVKSYDLNTGNQLESLKP